MSLVDDLRAHGIHTPASMPIQHIVDIRAELVRCRVYNAHVAAKAERAPEFGARALSLGAWKVFAPVMADLILAPHFFEYALTHFESARAYFGEFPRLYSLNAFWTCPTIGPLYTETQAWHRDGDDAKQYTIFMLGTDVDGPNDGEHQYQCGTHLTDDNNLGRDYREPPPDEIVRHVLGPAGTVFVVDTGGLHRALPPGYRPRLLLWARWGVMNPPRSYAWDGLHPVPKGWLGDRYPSNPELQEAIKLVVA